MSKHAFIETLRVNNSNKKKLFLVNNIIKEYAVEGYKLTLRQLYYQLVSRDIIPNIHAEYGKLSSLLVKGRMAGIVDWDAIEDRLRIPYIPYWVYGINDAINETINSYRLDRQKDQDIHIELWVEKDALSSVLRRITSHYHIKLVVNRGYSSCTAMHDAFLRIYEAENHGRKSLILYLGDHDPSGLDMVRDVRDRLSEFGVYPEVKHIGLTMNQIQKYNPPPNPAKLTDPRAKWYIKKFGSVSWEVDSLRPNVLDNIVKSNIEKHMNLTNFNNIIRLEKEHKDILRDFSEKFNFNK